MALLAPFSRATTIVFLLLSLFAQEHVSHLDPDIFFFNILIPQAAWVVLHACDLFLTPFFSFYSTHRPTSDSPLVRSSRPLGT